MSVALVTGAAQGVGRAIARRLHADGHVVVLADDAADANAAAAADLGERAEGITVDLRDAPAAEGLVAGVIERHGGLDVLVNNSAMAAQTELWDLSVVEWDDVLNASLRATFLLSRAAGAHMRERGFGRIVNLASLAAQAPRAGAAHDAAANAGIVALTRVFAAELAPHGVTINAIASGVTDTSTARAAAPEEIASLAAFLISDRAGFITGATYDVNGGALMR